ncbi:MAG: hypothetical protein QOJ98_3224 [Acidobacteriota bacterium]|nr:hypothetical protein [Acidobacteriota bacterium]
MTGFILKIFFNGLIAFMPNTDGTEITVLLVNTPHEYSMSDGSTLADHRPLLLARAASCTGTCMTDEQEIAQFMFANKTPQQAATALNSALLGGGAWQLSSSELAVIGPVEPLAIRTGVRGMENGTLKLVPSTAAEREDFSWVADLRDVSPGTGGFKTALTSEEAPPGCVVAARLKLRSGKVFTYSLVKIDGKARPVHFRKPSGDGPEAPYSQALANWVAAEIHVPGDSVEIVDTNFNDSSKTRTMKLHPQEGVVEIAILNLPPFEAPSPTAEAPSPQPGQHFQIYYDLVRKSPARAERLVPHQALSPSASEPQTDWASLHPRTALWSELLEQLGMSPRGKGPYELALCPIVKNQQP